MTTPATPEDRAALIERLKNEAQIHAQEARTANATIAEIYQIVTGKTGEPGNWNGAEPVRKCIEELRLAARSLAGRPADKLWCDTCEGTRTVYQEHQAGCHVGGDYPCPDCDGNGFRIRRSSPPADAAKAGAPQADLVADILKDCCECERPHHWDVETVELRVSDLTMILQRHIEGKE